MIRVRGMVFKDEDSAHDYFAQREIDDPFLAGLRAGVLGLPAGLNAYPLGTKEASDWERGRSSAEARRAAEELRQRARRSCEPCTCGGKGLCRDAA